MEDNIFALLALCGLFSHAVPLSVRSPYILSRNHQSPSNQKGINWQNSVIYDPSSAVTEQRVKASEDYLPESLEELRRWWSRVASPQRGGLYTDASQLSELAGHNSNLEDLADTPQDYNYLYGSDPFSDPINGDEAFRQALKAYILPGNPFLSSQTGEDGADLMMSRNRELSAMQPALPIDDEHSFPDFLFRSYPEETPEIFKDNESKKQNLRIDLPVRTSADSTSVPLPATEVATSQTPVSVGSSVLPQNTPVSKAKGQKEFAMLRPPSDNARKFDQWAKSAQDFMKSVASASVRETREARPVSPSKSEDPLPQQLNSLKRRSKRHTIRKSRDQTVRYY